MGELEKSQVRDFYENKNIFITGGTGFVGLCLIEKILRTIPKAGKIYLLMRPKKGVDIPQRLQEFAKNPVFEKLLKEKTTDIFEKLIAISGDVGEENLGLSPADRKTLVDNVNVVIHSAATLDFQEKLRPTVTINLLGTRRVMELCQQITDLKVMIHVSSAYANSYLTDVHERLYDAFEDPEQVLSIVSTLNDEALEGIETKLLKTHPNTYTFTKHLAEHEVAKCKGLFPCTIVRPTMIVAAWKEPVPGWTCSKVGPQGFLMGAAKGVVRRLPMAREKIADYIPVDVVVNELLVAGWQAAKQSSGLSIYHCSSSTQNPFKWQMIEASINGIIHKYPLKSAIWYPHLKFVSTLLMFKISAVFVHFFPAIILDMVLRLTGGKPILFRLHRNVWLSLNKLEKFIFTECKFHNENTIELNQQLGSTDKQLFYINIDDLKWVEYFTNLHIGVRKYLNKETQKTLAAARGKDTILLVVHILWHVLLVAFFWALAASLIDLPMTQCAWLVPIIYILYSFL